ncbi:hypothetical protein Slin15195_G117400 [Septoria linicola]|uniref:Uncharacterized protein n=1 Tax=Septoria linicola TaxID=215465 RepID=A0A9Q9B8Q4_9PEZI|nr:hypothetical protein Slin14017_G094410 [Septoria linicola]USW58421.1 hypothetical protein Slin15195_G117400 [Septoria linicola]
MDPATIAWGVIVWPAVYIGWSIYKKYKAEKEEKESEDKK